MIEIEKKPIETDVLIVGGGIAGLMAAINAAEQGVSVVVAEKANTRRSGSGATGNDHFLCYIPDVHGNDIDPIVKETRNSLIGGYHDSTHTIKFLEQSFARARDWDAWGISMRPRGKWEFMGHAFPGRPRIWLKYAGHNQKEVLTKQAKKRGVRIENHLPITDIITSAGEVIGAIGLTIRQEEPVLKLFRAKSIILTTGSASRLYPPAPSPGWLFNTAFCPSCTGAAQAMAYRAGAKLVNMEFPNRHAGPKFFARCGKSSWIGIYKDPHRKPIGPFVTKPTKELGDITSDVWNSVFTDIHKSGRGPAYIDCTETAEEDIEYMLWGMENEGLTSMLNYMKEEGIDVRRHMVEFMQYEPHLIGRGIDIDLNAESSVRGLFAAGDPVGNFRADIAGAATFGWIAGESAANRAKGITSFQKAEQSPLVNERASLYSGFVERQHGPSWKEANLALQQIMKDYAGTVVRSETLLKAGLKYFGDLREKTLNTMVASDSHDLMRTMEVLDLMECGEMIFVTALERKETRGLHMRSDFPFTNPLLQDKWITVRKQDGEPKLEWRERK
ncbi:MAG: FAD-dependent oxidoreductase [Deltaproteobacteria bacterium]|nr:FAD-dependent oxidoreductase [Deltaproteobacteria bacterium]